MQQVILRGEAVSNSMRFLSVVWYKVLPPKYGGQKGIALFNKYLSKQAGVVCLCSESNEPDGNEHYKIIPSLPLSKTQIINPSCWLRVLRTVNKEKCSHIILEHPYYGIAGVLAKKLKNVKLIVHSHNIEYLRFQKQNKWWWRLLFSLERRTHRNADLSLFKTESDQRIAIEKFKLEINKTLVLSYSVERPNITLSKANAHSVLCKRYGLSEETKLLLFAGTLDYEPNAKAVELLVEKILPLLSIELSQPFKIIICGRNEFGTFQYLKQLKHEHFIYAGEVEDIESYFTGADVFINPVLQTNGIQTKIIDALSYDCNVVCFEKALEGIPTDLVSNKIFIAENNDYNQFVQKIRTAINTEAHVPPDFFERFSWGNAMADFLRKLSTT